MSKGVFICINTDAGFFPHDKVGSYAYWIRGTGIYLTGSGMFRGHVEGPWQAEMKAMINALHILRKSTEAPVIGFIFNRDNKFAFPGRRNNELKSQLGKEIDRFKSDAIKKLGSAEFARLTKNSKNYAQFRHVPGHSDTQDKRSYVNRWLDGECKSRLREWLQKHKQKKFEAR